MKRETVKTSVAVAGILCVIGLFLFLQRPVPAPEPEPLVDGSPLTSYTLRLRHAEVRQELMDTLIQNRSKFIPALVELMGANESVLKRLIRRTSATIASPLKNALQLDQNPEVYRAGASWGLLHLLRGYSASVPQAAPDEAAILLPALRNALEDESIFVRLNAAACIAALDRNSPEVQKLLRTALNDTNRGVRYNAVYALWNMFLDEAKVTGMIDTILEKDQNNRRAEALKNLKDVVAVALGTYDDPNDFE